MFSRASLPLPLALALALAAAPTSAGVPRLLSLQGRLADSAGSPQTGTETLTIRVFDASSGGSAIATETDVVSLDAGGVFVTTLGDGSPLEPSAFDRQLWAEVEPASAGGPLSPRLPLRAAPYALRAAWAEQFARNLVVVSHTGDDAASATALRDALLGITDAGPGNPYTLLVGPGVYDFGGTALAMFPSVSLVGSGVGSTVLEFSVDGPAAVFGADDTELRDLTIRNDSGGGATTGGVSAAFSGLEMTLRDLRVEASDGSGGAARALFLGQDAQVRVLSSQLVATGLNTESATAVEAQGTGSYTFSDSLLEARGPNGAYRALDLSSGTPRVRLRSSRLETSAFLGGATGVRVLVPGELELSGVDLHSEATSSGGATGVLVQEDAEVLVRDSAVEVGSQQTAGAVGVEVDSLSALVEVLSTRIQATTPEAVAARSTSGSMRIHGSRLVAAADGATAEELTFASLVVTSSQLIGGAPSGAVTCGLVTDEAGTVSTSTCP